MRFLVGAWLFCLIGYILTGCSPVPETPKEKISYAIPFSNLILLCQKQLTHNNYGDCQDSTGQLRFDRINNATNVVELKDK